MVFPLHESLDQSPFLHSALPVILMLISSQFLIHGYHQNLFSDNQTMKIYH